MRQLTLAASCAAIALSTFAAVAAPPPPGRPGSPASPATGISDALDAPSAPPVSTAPATGITEIDVRTCLGVDGSKPRDQVKMCTKILASGKVKPPLTADYYATRAAAYFALDQMTPALADMGKAI